MPEAGRGGRARCHGRVLDELPNALYRVELETEERPQVTAHVAGRRACSGCCPGDAVVVELMPYDTTRGRIVARRR